VKTERKTTLVVGLGNPGAQYAKTRHNVGFQVVERLASRLGAEFARHPGRALVARGVVADVAVMLAKPQTFMNLSGFSVAALIHWYHLNAYKDLLVVYDDLDLLPGMIRLRPRGGAGGHKGVRSVIDQLGTQDFCRLRIGIGKPEFGDAHRYVLQEFTAEEWNLLDVALERAADAVECFAEDGIVAAMNRFNGG
jgi:PTH1 family peptidyl-tRNA hydrolase